MQDTVGRRQKTGDGRQKTEDRRQETGDKRREHACVSYTRIKSVFLRWMPSLNDRSKLKGESTDVKSGCGASVGPSLNPHSLS